MRKIFASAFGVAAIGATLFGAAYAWSTTASTGSFAAEVGAAELTLVCTDNANQLGPDNGSFTVVAACTVTNTGSFPLVSVAGVTLIGSVTPGAPAPVDGICTTALSNFVGDVSGLVGTLAVSAGDAFDARIAVPVGADEDCQGDTANYSVTVSAST